MAELEALAYQRAIQFTLEIGLTQVVVERDSTTVIEATVCQLREHSWGHLFPSSWFLAC